MQYNMDYDIFITKCLSHLLSHTPCNSSITPISDPNPKLYVHGPPQQPQRLLSQLNYTSFSTAKNNLQPTNHPLNLPQFNILFRFHNFPKTFVQPVHRW